MFPIEDDTGRLLVSWSQCRLLEQLEDDGDPDTEDTQIVPCTDERLAAAVSVDPDSGTVATADADGVVRSPLAGDRRSRTLRADGSAGFAGC